jgi:N-acetyl-anhydromuramyl-L-alanine amidase AmpD
MSIAEHVHSLQQHLAQYGLYPVPADADREESEIFKICFLNKYEMQRWRELRESEQCDDRLSQKREQGNSL